MSPAEYGSLPPNCSVTKVLCKVTPLGYRTPFIAGSAALAYTNSNSLVFYAHGMGIANKHSGTHLNIDTASSKNPMLPASVLPTAQAQFADKMWGTNTKNQLLNNAVPTCFNGIQENRNVYACHFTAESVDPTLSFPMMNDDLNIGILSNDAPNPPILYEYRPQVNVIKHSSVYPQIADTEGFTSVNLGLRNPMRYTNKIQSISPGSSHTETMYAEDKVWEASMNEERDYFTTIEMAGTMTHGFTEPSGGLKPPSFHVGVMPIHAFTNVADETSWQTLFAYWHIETEIFIDSAFSLTRSLKPYLHPNQMANGINNTSWISSLNPIEYAYGHRGYTAGLLNPSSTSNNNNLDFMKQHLLLNSPALNFLPKAPHMFCTQERDKIQKSFKTSGSTTAAPVTAVPFPTVTTPKP